MHSGNIPINESPPTAASPFLEREVSQSIGLAQENLLSKQFPDGHWEGELVVDSTLCSDLVLYLHWSGESNETLQAKCCDHIRTRQLPDGGWAIFPGGPSEINASVKAYFALKLSGDLPSTPWMHQARAAILRLGGIPQLNTYSKFYLALLGQVPWKFLPSIPPEIFLLPRWFFFNLYELSSWTRAIIAPLTILHHYKPTRELTQHLMLHELYPAGMEGQLVPLHNNEKAFSSRSFFQWCDKLWKFYERFPSSALRQKALKAAETWMIDRMGDGSGGLAAIFPAMLNALMALRVLGYQKNHPIFQKAENDLKGLFVDDEKGFRIQPCLSPVWDTSITTLALTDSGLPPNHPAIEKAVRWLESREIRFKGDWTAKNPHPEPSGWAFEHENQFYPDTDDTMMVLMALHVAGRQTTAQFERALRWLMSFQCKNGGWAAFDKDVTARWLENIPFADHNAILDPPCSDLTARVLELIGRIGYDRQSRLVQRAIQFLKEKQEADGSWFGRWGVNHLYGTWQVLRGLSAIGQNMNQDWILRARDWLESCQNEDGGWGETPESYDFPALKGRGPSTASQTSWAIMGLCACGEVNRPSIKRGIHYLVKTQNPDGSWTEDQATGTGFPKVFYLKYEMYRQHFPLMALATFEKLWNQSFDRAEKTIPFLTY